jgi:HD superfamily phosphodiesterase
MLKENVILEMKNIYHDNPKGIEHTLKVLEYTEMIVDSESFNSEDKEKISITAILHDIGIPEAIRKYGSSEAKYQEKEGEIIAREILERLNYKPNLIDRVCYIVGNHHTKSKVDDLDFQIIWEADMLVNLENKHLSQEVLTTIIDENFETNLGKNIASKKYIEG